MRLGRMGKLGRLERLGRLGRLGQIGKIGKIRRGYHNPIIPIIPIIPIFPIFPIFPINSTSISEINLLSEGCRVLHSAKMPPMGSTRRTSHWWLFLLGAAIDPLSQQIIDASLADDPLGTVAYRPSDPCRRSRQCFLSPSCRSGEGCS